MAGIVVEEELRKDLPHLSEGAAAELARAVAQIVSSLAPERIYLFGSNARGEANPDSDLDLLVVVSRGDRQSLELAQVAYGAVGRHVTAMDILVMPREEFEWRSRSPASLPAAVLREGKLLYAA